MDGLRAHDIAAMVAATPIPLGHVDAVTGVELFRASGVEPYPFQRRMLGEGSSHAWRAIDVARQGGKTTGQGAGALATVSQHRRIDVGVLAPRLDQAQQVLGDVRQFYLDHHELFGRRMPDLLNPRSENPKRLLFSNGSRVLAMTAGGGTLRMGKGYGNRGPRLKRLIIEEAAYVPWEAVEALIPALGARDGDIIATSTMWLDVGWWWDVINGIGDKADLFDVIRVTAKDLPHITADHLDKARRAMGEEAFLREYYSVPPKRRGTLIPGWAIDRMLAAATTIDAVPVADPPVDDWAPNWNVA